MSELFHFESLKEPIGLIAEVHGPVVVIACRRLPPLRQALCACINGDMYLFEVHQHLDEEHIRAITLHRTSGLWRGMTVYDLEGPLKVPVSPECLGRLLNIFGKPLDGKPRLPSVEFRNIHGKPSPLHQAMGVSGVLETGIKVIDLLCPFVKGGQEERSRLFRA